MLATRNIQNIRFVKLECVIKNSCPGSIIVDTAWRVNNRISVTLISIKHTLYLVPGLDGSKKSRGRKENSFLTARRRVKGDSPGKNTR